MKKILLTISFLAVIVSTTIAHTISVGYVLHQEGSDSKLTTNGKTACSAAILLDSDKLAQYGGNGIRSVRVSLPNTKVFVDSVVVWVRNSIDGENLAMGKITRFKDDGFDNISKGWNEVELDKEVALTADSLWCGKCKAGDRAAEASGYPDTQSRLRGESERIGERQY